MVLLEEYLPHGRDVEVHEGHESQHRLGDVSVLAVDVPQRLQAVAHSRVSPPPTPVRIAAAQRCGHLVDQRRPTDGEGVEVGRDASLLLEHVKHGLLDLPIEGVLKLELNDDARTIIAAVVAIAAAVFEVIAARQSTVARDDADVRESIACAASSVVRRPSSSSLHT